VPITFSPARRLMMARERMGTICASLLCLTLLAGNTTAQQTSAAPPNPCAVAEQQQLSFWVGEWDLTWPGNQPSEVQHGTNSVRRVLDGCICVLDGNQGVDWSNCETAFARAALGGPDQLRQRVAFALSQILVVSGRDLNLLGKSMAMMEFYDIFVRNAFGNYYDVLREVSFHPVMGVYLSHIGNQKAHATEDVGHSNQRNDIERVAELLVGDPPFVGIMN